MESKKFKRTLKQKTSKCRMSDIVLNIESDTSISKLQSDTIIDDNSGNQNKMNERENEPKIINDTVQLTVPQLTVDANGEIIIDASSLIIESIPSKKDQIAQSSSEIIVYDEKDYKNPKNFDKKRSYTKEWSPNETFRFYKCLQKVGADFSHMASMFPGRTRDELKVKFKTEEKRNESLIKETLKNSKFCSMKDLKEACEFEQVSKVKEKDWRKNEIRKATRQYPFYIKTQNRSQIISMSKFAVNLEEELSRRNPYFKCPKLNFESNNTEEPENFEDSENISTIEVDSNEPCTSTSIKKSKFENKAGTSGNISGIRSQLPNLLPDDIELEY